jgi:hypothetical protein
MATTAKTTGTTGASAKNTFAKLEAELEQTEVQLMIKSKRLEMTKDLTKSDIELLNAEVTVLTAKKISLTESMEELTVAVEDERNSKYWAKERPLVEKAILEYHVGYLGLENKILFCKDMGKSVINAIFFEFEAAGQKPVRTFNMLCKTILKGADTQKIIDLISKMGRSYIMRTSSFADTKWDGEGVYNQAQIIMNFWTQPNLNEYETYNTDFDILMHCIGGGKKENIDHLEQWVGYKFCHPDRVANTPNLDIGGQPGGNGKGRFVKLCETIFSPVCVIEAAAKEIMSGFNANWASAVVIHYDEPEEDELPNSKIKNATGGETQRIERKGVDAFMADRNFSFIFTSNNETGVVKLTGNRAGEDRRYSVMITNIVMVDYIMELENCDFDTAKQRVNSIAQLVKNNEEVAKWLAHVMIKHNVMNMEVLQPLHGIDYSNRFEDQKTILNRAFDAIFPVFLSQKFIATDLLLELIHILTDNEKYKAITVRRHFESYLKNKKMEPRMIDRVRIDYQWKGVSTHQYKDRVQRSIITLAPVQPVDVFDYSTVSSAKMVKGIGLTADACILSLN